jgi:hypothetical protein
VASDVRPAAVGHVLIPTAALAYATAAGLAHAPVGTLTTYRAGSEVAATFDLVAGFGLIMAGLATVRGRKGSVAGPLAVLAAVPGSGSTGRVGRGGRT